MDITILNGVYESFVTGRDCPPPEASKAPGRLFAELLNAQMHSHLPVRESAVVEQCWARNYQSILAARKGQIEQSRQELESVRSVLRESSMSVEASLLIQVLLEPAEAYLYYKLNDYEHARDLVLSASSLNHRLTNEFGFGIISAQRMQLCHNILRINSKQGRRKETVQLASAFLDYLEFGNGSLPSDISWAWVERDAVPESILQFYFHHICGEAALALAGVNDSQLFQPIAHHANLPECRGMFGRHSHAWVGSKHTMLKGDCKRYLPQACELLQHGRASESSLWFATIIDVVSVCSSLGAEGVGVANQISLEASQLDDAPWCLRSAVVSLLGAGTDH